VKLGGITGKYRGQRQGDAADMAILEWVDITAAAAAAVEEKPAAEAKSEETSAEGKAEKKTKGRKKKAEGEEAKA
jgi:hypothetical protein